MKRLFSILLLFCYLIILSGVTVHQHYCGNNLSSQSFFINHKAECGCKEESNNDNCCHDVTKVSKLEVKHNVILSGVKINVKTISIIFSELINLFSHYFGYRLQCEFVTCFKPPPLELKPKIFIEFRQILI